MWASAPMSQGPALSPGAGGSTETLRHFARHRRLRQKSNAAELQRPRSPGLAADQLGTLAVKGKAVGLDDPPALAPRHLDLGRIHEGIEQAGVGDDHLLADRDRVKRPPVAPPPSRPGLEPTWRRAVSRETAENVH